jgi:hypothetical protein
VKAEARRLHAAGLTGPQVAESMGLSYPTVKSWLWPPSDTVRLRRLERERENKRRRRLVGGVAAGYARPKSPRMMSATPAAIGV